MSPQFTANWPHKPMLGTNPTAGLKEKPHTDVGRQNLMILVPLNNDTKILTETKTETFFRDQILRKRYRNPPKIGKSCEIVLKYFPPSPSLFFFFSRKKDIYFSEYFPPLSSPFFFSLGIEHQRKRSSLFFPLSNRLE